MVCRLIEEQDVGLFIDEFTKSDFCLFSTTEDTNLAFDVFGGKPTFGKGRADFILCEGWKFTPDFFDAGGFVIALHFLFKVSDLQILSQFTRTRECRN